MFVRSAVNGSSSASVTAPKPGRLYSLKPVLRTGDHWRNGRSVRAKRMSGNATVVGVNAQPVQLADPGILGDIHARRRPARRPGARSSLGIGVDGLLRIARIGFFGTWAIRERAPGARSAEPTAGEGRGRDVHVRVGWARPDRVERGRRRCHRRPATRANVDLTGAVASVNKEAARIPEDGIVVQALGAPAKRCARTRSRARRSSRN